MRLTMLAIGSRGDVQPLIALAAHLRNEGHTVRCGAPADFAGAVRAEGLEFFPLTGNASSFYSGRAGIALRERTRNAREFNRFFDDYLSTFLNKLLVSAWEASQDADMVLVWAWTRLGPSLAERLGIPVVTVSMSPVLHLPTREFSNPFQGPGHLPLGPLYNLLTWRWALPFTRIGQKQVDHWRQQSLGLPPIPWKDELKALRRSPHLFGFSPEVLPKPRDWAEWIHVTGYWFLERPSNYQPPPELAAFVAAGEPPVAVGFSSQVGRDSQQVTQTVVDSLEHCGKRGVLIAGWGSLTGVKLPSTVLAVPTVPYDWLLPRLSAMIHHGGAGSTASAIRAGLPSFAVPFGYEQELWGRRIARLGVGADPVFPKRMTVRGLAKSITRVTSDPRLRARVVELRDRVRAEDGLGRAAREVERLLDARRGRKVFGATSHAMS